MIMNANTKAIDIDIKAAVDAASISSAAGAPSTAATVGKSDAVANIAVEPKQQQQQVAANEVISIEVLNGKDKEEMEPDKFGNTYAAAMETENKAITTDNEKGSSKVLASASVQLSGTAGAVPASAAAAPSAAADSSTNKAAAVTKINTATTAPAAAETQQPKAAEAVEMQATISSPPEVASNNNKDEETDEFGNTYTIETEAADAKVDTNMKEVSKASQSSTNAAATKEIASPATTSTKTTAAASSKPTKVATSFSVYSERKSDFLIKTATPDGSSKAISSVSDARLPIYTERH